MDHCRRMRTAICCIFVSLILGIFQADAAEGAWHSSRVSVAHCSTIYKPHEAWFKRRSPMYLWRYDLQN